MTVLQEMYETGNKFGLFARPYFCKATKSAQMDAKCNLDFYISEITSFQPFQGSFLSPGNDKVLNISRKTSNMIQTV